MKEHYRSISALAILACACVIGLNGHIVSEADGSPLPSTAPGADDARLQNVIKRLASTDFNEREAAQKELDRADWREKETLVRLAAEMKGGEAESRVLARVQAIEEEIACDPPPISLEIKNATLEEVVAALDKTKGIGLKIGSTGEAPYVYTLAAHDRPFWEIFRSLSAQHRLLLENYDGAGLRQQRAPRLDMSADGPLAVFPESLERERTSDLQKPPGNELQHEELHLRYEIATDPRIRVERYREPRLTAVVDELGNNLLEQGAKSPNTWYFHGMPGMKVLEGIASLKLSAKHGKKIVSAKGELNLVVGLTTQKVEVIDVAGKLNQPLAVAGRSITITQWDENAVHTYVRAAIDNNEDYMKAPITDVRTVLMTLIDSANGRRLCSVCVGHSSGSMGFECVGPIKLELQATTKAKEIVLPFEMNNLSLPVENVGP